MSIGDMTAIIGAIVGIISVAWSIYQGRQNAKITEDRERHDKEVWQKQEIHEQVSEELEKRFGKNK